MFGPTGQTCTVHIESVDFDGFTVTWHAATDPDGRGRSLWKRNTERTLVSAKPTVAAVQGPVLRIECPNQHMDPFSPCVFVENHRRDYHNRDSLVEFCVS